MTLETIKAEIKKIGWDSKHADADDERFINALKVSALNHGQFPTAEEKANGITVRKTGAGRFVAKDLATGYATEPLVDQRAALGRLRANMKTASAFNLPLHK